jgi:hypothetical protein
VQLKDKWRNLVKFKHVSRVEADVAASKSVTSNSRCAFFGPLLVHLWWSGKPLANLERAGLFPSFAAVVHNNWCMHCRRASGGSDRRYGYLWPASVVINGLSPYRPCVLECELHLQVELTGDCRGRTASAEPLVEIERQRQENIARNKCVVLLATCDNVSTSVTTVNQACPCATHIAE